MRYHRRDGECQQVAIDPVHTRISKRACVAGSFMRKIPAQGFDTPNRTKRLPLVLIGTVTNTDSVLSVSRVMISSLTPALLQISLRLSDHSTWKLASPKIVILRV